MISMPLIDELPLFYRDEFNSDGKNIRKEFKKNCFLTQKKLSKLLKMAGFKNEEGKLEYTRFSTTVFISFHKEFITVSLLSDYTYPRKKTFSYCEAEGISLHHELLCSCLNFTVSNNPSLDSLAKKIDIGELRLGPDEPFPGRW
ncbi:MAG: hypothetical protein ACI9ES_002626 [Oceanospirillaceae bacterium]|jgi:hypothetical protein